MLQNSGSITQHANSPLSPVEREQRYQRGLRELRNPRSYQIRITGKMVRGLLKRGYLRPEERDDWDAIEQAANLFLWDALPSKPKKR